MNVLFVDDQMSVLEGISSEVNFRELYVDNVRFATSAQKAYEIMDEMSIDLLICDIEMPGEDGFSVIRNTKKKHPNTLLVMLTAHAEFEYAQESVRLGCYDYLVQPVAYEELEKLIRRANQDIFDRQKRNQLYEVGRRMKTGEMELLDGIILNLLSSNPDDIESAMELLKLLEFPIDRQKKAQIILLDFDEYRKSDDSSAVENKIHKLLSNALKAADIVYPMISLSTVNHHRQFVLLLYSAIQKEPELSVGDFHRFFKQLCNLSSGAFQCCIGGMAPFGGLRTEYRRVRESLNRNDEVSGVLRLEYNGDNRTLEDTNLQQGNAERWKNLLSAGQQRIFAVEFENSLEYNLRYASDKQKALRDLHQKLTHTFFDFLYSNNANTSNLFGGSYSYDDFMSSYSSAEALMEAVNYIVKTTRDIGSSQLPVSDIEKAKTFITDNISDPITVKDVADHICLSPEYFTKLFKKETGQNIKEYITVTKIEAAKDMLENSPIPVGMVALELGYTNFSHFSQVFKKYENMSPSEYRNMVLEKKK